MTCRDSLRGGEGRAVRLVTVIVTSSTAPRLVASIAAPAVRGGLPLPGGLLSTKDFKRRVQIQDVLRGITEMPRRITPNITQIKLTEKTKTFAD